MRKKSFTLCMIAALTGSFAFTAFADEATGPASETVVEISKEATGPASETIVEIVRESTEPAQNQENAKSLEEVQISQIDPARPMIAFTFDDGPYTKVDEVILQTLENYGGKATFFVAGSRIAQYRDTLKRISDSGSEIGNHTFDHAKLENLSRENIVMQVERTNDAVEAVTGIRPRLVRVPYGAYKGQVKESVAYPLIQWNVDTRDWSSKNKTAVFNKILEGAKDGAIILMHDLYGSTGEAFAEAVPRLKEMGFQFVTVSEMYAAKGIPMEAGTVYFSAN